MTSQPKPHITHLREALMATLTDLRNRENPMELDRARAVANVASVLVDAARVEVEFIRASGNAESEFFEPPGGVSPGPLLPGVTSRVHRIKG